LFTDAFDALPLACIVNEKYFCVHGGITDKAKTVKITYYFRLMIFKKYKDHAKYHYQDRFVI